MIALLLVLSMIGLMQAARTFYAAGAETPPMSGTTLAFGFLLLTALFVGRLFSKLRLPRLTGYLACGVLVGPSVMGLVTPAMLHELAPVKGIAVCLIALTAGGELNVRRMMPLFRTIRSMTLWAVCGTALLCSIAVFALSPFIPFFDGVAFAPRLAVSAVLGTAISAMSPAVTMALFSELNAEGPVTRTILGVVVVADLVVIVLFALTSSLAQSALGGSADALSTALHLAWELFGSMLVGALLGAVLALYLKKVQGGRALFVLLLCAIMSEVGGRLALDPLLLALAAGLFVENVTKTGASELVHDIESASLPVYVVFFALAGALLDLATLRSVAVPAVLLVMVRASGMFFGARTAARRTNAEPAVARWAFVGMLPQAGLALAIALIIPKVIPSFGAEASALIVGIVGINELIMPAVLRWGLIRAGEARPAPPPEPGAAPRPAPTH